MDADTQSVILVGLIILLLGSILDSQDYPKLLSVPLAVISQPHLGGIDTESMKLLRQETFAQMSSE